MCIYMYTRTHPVKHCHHTRGHMPESYHMDALDYSMAEILCATKVDKACAQSSVWALKLPVDDALMPRGP